MPLNFTPLEYSPYQYNNTQAPPNPYWQNYDSQDQFKQVQADYSAKQKDANTGQFRGYTGDQFQSLFDSVNNLGSNPMVSGSAYNNTPQYTPYGGTPAQFTTGTQAGRMDWDYEGNQYFNDPDGPTVFDHQGYDNARFDSINDYLGKMGSFFGNMGSDQAVQQAQQARQKDIARQAFQASLPQAPQMDFQQSAPIYTGGGWGQQSPTMPLTPMTHRSQAPSGALGTTNRGTHGGILGGTE